MKRRWWVIVCSLLCVLMCGIVVLARYTNIFTMPADNARVAKFAVQVDGLDVNGVQYKALATTKLTDIAYMSNTGLYDGGSFLEGAYQSHLITIRNDSEVALDLHMDYGYATHDDRVFFAVIEGASRNILKSLYAIKNTLADTSITTIRSAITNALPETLTVAPNKTQYFTVVFWCEHDAVFKDTDGDGVADEEGKRLNELVDGVPQETITFDVELAQGRG